MTKKTGKAAGKLVTKAKVNGRQIVKSASTQNGKAEAGYKGHLVGSRKGQVHETFDKAGAEDALKHGLQLGLKQGTLKSWFGGWQRASAEKKADKGSAKAA